MDNAEADQLLYSTMVNADKYPMIFCLFRSPLLFLLCFSLFVLVSSFLGSTCVDVDLNSIVAKRWCLSVASDCRRKVLRIAFDVRLIVAERCLSVASDCRRKVLRIALDVHSIVAKRCLSVASDCRQKVLRIAFDVHSIVAERC